VELSVGELGKDLEVTGIHLVDGPRPFEHCPQLSIRLFVHETIVWR
jgi:hypothetical protein